MRVSVLFHPPAGGALLPPGPCTVIVDVLRATTTLTVALANGARAVIPVGAPEEALALRAARPGLLACGERGGRIVPGFDLGNSPDEYTAARVGGRTLAFASTNGALAMLAARRSRRRVLASFANAAAAVEAVRREREITILCAGKLGAFSLEDAACAGLLLARLERHGGRAADPAARLALSLAPRDAGEARALVEGCSHGRELRALGADYARDLVRCAGLDTLERAYAL